jgi:hypothetical protein
MTATITIETSDKKVEAAVYSVDDRGNPTTPRNEVIQPNSKVVFHISGDDWLEAQEVDE